MQSERAAGPHGSPSPPRPGCRADDVLTLIKVIKEKVYERNQIVLESEVKIWP